MEEAKMKKVEGIPEELVARAQECSSPEEVLELARNESVELTDEQLESVAGGNGWVEAWAQCPYDGYRIEHVTGDIYRCVVCQRESVYVGTVA